MSDDDFHDHDVKVSVDRLVQVKKGESVRITMEARKICLNRDEVAEELDALETLVRRQMKKHIMRETRGAVPKRTPEPR